MIIYRPQRSTLVESMMEAKEFNNFDEIRQYIVDQENKDGKTMVSFDNIHVRGVRRSDPRCGWWDCMEVCVSVYGDEKSESGFCLGIMATSYVPYNKNYWDHRAN